MVNVYSVTRINATQVELAVAAVKELATHRLTVANVKDVGGHVIDPAHDSLVFAVQDLNPQLASATVIGTTIRCVFSEAMADAGLTTITNYVFAGPTSLTTSTVTKISSTTVDVVPTEEMRTGGSYTITVSNVTDAGGKVIDPDNDSQTFAGVGVAPQVSSAAFVDTTHLDVTFDSDMEQTTMETNTNYSLTGASTPTITAAVRQTAQIVRLTTNPAMVEGNYTISVINVTDLVGNVVDPAHDTANFRSGLVLIMATGYFKTGTGFEYTSDRTYSWDDTSWAQLNPAHPPVSPPGVSYGRHQAWSAYDSNRRKVVLFGGQGYAGGYINTTWEFDGTDWTQISTAHSPSVRIMPRLVFDSINNVIVLFGGYGGGGALKDTWTYDGVDWTQQSPLASPSTARYCNSLCYDPIRQEVVMYGGQTGSWPFQWLSDTWTYDGTTWTNKTPAHDLGARTGGHSAWDEVNNCVIYFGGRLATAWDTSIAKEDTWKWTGTDWVEIITGVAPTARSCGMMSTYPNHNRIILVGGSTDADYWNYDTWSFDGTNWSNVAVSIPDCLGIYNSTLCPSV